MIWSFFSVRDSEPFLGALDGLKSPEARHDIGSNQSSWMIFDELELWSDPVARGGPEAMAVDEWLLETCTRPLLRIYSWKGNWGSIGYFGKLNQARESLPGLDWVRRWTGGGVVNHSDDWTYSLIVPQGHIVARLKGGESYRLIHEVLVRVMAAEVGAAALSSGKGKGNCLCFENAVEYDVEDAAGNKLAGAAQRRGKFGLLHQGSVRSIGGCATLRGKIFTENLAGTWSEVEIFVDESRLSELVDKKYGAREWLERR